MFLVKSVCIVYMANMVITVCNVTFVTLVFLVNSVCIVYMVNMAITVYSEHSDYNIYL